MDRCWFLTWSVYGTWLPGDDRGFVSDLRTPSGDKFRSNQPRTDYPVGAPGLRQYAATALAAPPLELAAAHAAALLPQLRETAAYRRWHLLAAAVMWNHVHVLVAVPGDPDPVGMLRDFKSYGSRALNRRGGRPAAGTWWTESGSTRKKATDEQVRETVEYVRAQPHPLALLVDDDLVRRFLDGDQRRAERGERPA